MFFRYCQFAAAMFLMLLVIESLTQIVGVLIKVRITKSCTRYIILMAVVTW